MFGLDKLKDFKKNAEEAKARLDSITVEGVAGADLVKVVCTASKKVVSVDINESVLRTGLKPDIDKLVAEAMNNALAQAESVTESEMRGILPNIPGLGL
ncbi:MAG: YbaB/EbfC family nucleoid-associated protein [Bacteroidia bacterium]|nr:YbaB/EbfC family nucleoid-associated protein [Bacteroidia bacterium]